MVRHRLVVRATLGVALFGVITTAGADAAIDRGAYLYRAAGCGSCHTDRENNGLENAGGVVVQTPFGKFYAPNITPDPVHGIGKWSEADFIKALRDGVNPAGQHYYPAFPYSSYTRLTDDDLRVLWAYLRSRPAVAQPNRPHEVAWIARMRSAIGWWKQRYFSPGPFMPDPARSAKVNRGAYLAEAAAHCAECHSPRDRFGGIVPSLRYAGTGDGPEGGVVPNITPDKKTGLGRWRESEIAYYLETGLTPDGDSAGDLMAEVIDNGLSELTKDDLAAIAAFLKSLAPIEHAVRKPKAKPQKKSDETRF